MGTTNDSHEIHSKTSQHGGRTLQQLRDETYFDVQALFSYALNGGITGIYMRDEYPIHFISDQLLEGMELTYTQYMEFYHGNHIETISPEYRDEYKKKIQVAFREGSIFDFISPVATKSGNPCWMRDVGKVMENDRNIFLLLRLDVTDMFKSQNELSEKVNIYEERSHELEALAANIPGGVCTISTTSDDYFVVYGNAGFYSLFGYTPQQLKEEHQNRLASLIYAKDQELVRNIIADAQAQSKDIFEFEHRIVRRSGEIIWILVRGSFSDSKESTLFNCVVIDITSRKKLEEEARINEKRFRIALSQTDNTIFEYDIANHIMIHGERSARYYGLQQYTENVPWSLVENGVIHPDTADDFLAMYSSICGGAPSASCNIKARLTSGEYAWRKITMTTIYDENGVQIQAIGILEDIDERVRREESLLYQSEHDPLTGIYNRRAALSRIDEKLKIRYASCISALLIMDIDNFKQVNDRFGHRFGDYVLRECTDRITALFRKDEIVGRIGGDEFIIFANNLPSTSIAVSCAKRVARTFMKVFSFQDWDAVVSCCIGIAIAPNDGNTFDELYQNADIALYSAKKSGKNAIVSYQKDLGSAGKWTPYSNTEIDI